MGTDPGLPEPPAVEYPPVSCNTGSSTEIREGGLVSEWVGGSMSFMRYFIVVLYCEWRVEAVMADDILIRPIFCESRCPPLSKRETVEQW